MSEHDEACAFAVDMLLLNIPFYHLPNENPAGAKIVGHKEEKPIWGKNWGAIKRRQDEGISKGLPDYLIIIPAERSKYARQLILFIELKLPPKRLKRKSPRGNKGDLVPQSEISQEQIDFIDLINKSADVSASICHGFKQATAFVKKYIK